MPTLPPATLPLLPRFRERAVFLALPGPVLNLLHQRLYMQRAFGGQGMQAVRIIPGQGRMLGLARSFPTIGGAARVSAPRLPHYDPKRRFAFSGASLNRWVDAIRRTTPIAGFGLHSAQVGMGCFVALAPWALADLGFSGGGGPVPGFDFAPPYHPRQNYMLTGQALNRLAAGVRAATPLPGLGLSCRETPQGRVLSLDHRVLDSLHWGGKPPREPGDPPDDPPASSDGDGDGSDIIIIVDPPDDPDPPSESDSFYDSFFLPPDQ